MNLIEQLGGYESAKNYAIDANACGAFEDERKIKDALHQYRRENNIFEVGDYVVFTVDMSDIWDMEEIYRINEHSHGQYSVYKFDEKICWCGDQVFDQEFRHATPEEIQAGHRIEKRQIETDYVSDIRNHIAPTTVVIER